MTVEELINRLKVYPANTKVVIECVSDYVTNAGTWMSHKSLVDIKDINDLETRIALVGADEA
jgi:hypothetical protein